jgi:hypothetical protein
VSASTNLMILPGQGRLVHEQRQHVEQASEIGGRPWARTRATTATYCGVTLGAHSVRNEDVTGYESANKVKSGG